MQIKFIKLLVLSVIIFIIAVFFIGLNQSSIYDTKGLVGQKLKDIKLEYLIENKVILEKDLKKNNFTLP